MPFVELSDCSVLYLDVGQGAPLVFIHGFPLDHSMWQHQVSELQTSNRVIALDLPGFGQSSAPEGEMSIVGFADRISEFLEKLGIEEPVTLCGLSMGGSIALQFALRHPQKLARLILCDCRAAGDTEEGQKVRFELAARVIVEGSDFVAASMPARLFAPRTLVEQTDLVETTQDVIRSTPDLSVAGGSQALANRLDVVPRLGEINVPTLIIVGSEDVISTVDEMRAMAGLIPNCHMVEIPGAGHMAPLEAPALVNAEIQAWLAAN